MLIRDRETLRDQGKILPTPHEISEENFAAGIELRHLQVRVLDDGLRGEVEALQRYTLELTLAPLVQANAMPAEEAMRAIVGMLTDLTTRYSAVTETLGTLLRAELGRTVDVTSEAGH